VPPARVRASLEEICDYAELPIASWEEVWPEFLADWDQGQHLVTLGKTGLGKTTFSFDVLEKRHRLRGASCAIFCTKKRDETVAGLQWPQMKEWPPNYKQRRARKFILWPTYTKGSTYPVDARPILLDALDGIIDEGSWTLYLDEASYLVEQLKLRISIDELFTQSRSNGITLIAGSQRPVWVSRAMVSQHTWLACFKIGDWDDAKRAAEVLGDRDRFAEVVNRLDIHDFVLVNTNTGGGVVSRLGT
jgi:hypothetical protein